MRQKRSCEHVGSPCKHTRSFLDLPTGVRRRIYELAGLIVGRRINLVPGRVELRGGVMPRLDLFPSADYPEEFYRFIRSVLRVSRAVHDEVIAILLSQNALVVPRQTAAYGLDFLRRLAPRHCYHITDLYVYLNCHITGHILAAWENAAAHVFSHGRSDTLKLHLTCETSVTNDRTLNAVLGRSMTSQELWQTAKFDFLGKDERATSARWPGRQPVMRWAAIVPNRPLDKEFSASAISLKSFCDRSWSTQILLRPLRRSNGTPEWATTHNSSEYTAAVTRTTTSLMMAVDSGSASRLVVPGKFGSFCGTVSSSYSRQCHCWLTPASLMLVCRSMYDDAQAVFYSQNRLICSPDADAHRVTRYRPTRDRFIYSSDRGNRLSASSAYRGFDASRFITRLMWPSTLYHLMFLELVFPPVELLWCPASEDPIYRDWLFAIDHLAANANVANLTLIVHMSTATSYFIDQDYKNHKRHMGDVPASAHANTYPVTSPARPESLLSLPRGDLALLAQMLA
ncbi:Uu.00g096060.m01.CDS01 [Anthostomella pinea]|uniref:Uu.00g096060.m01.CDS01 n=1 Tax=Anthostomella pinea TaxID=933095 RepID=A0AAI8VCU8_9PEZI|nr:Uu.00g096060.m01.CDS01 [Anthostomella pinea]